MKLSDLIADLEYIYDRSSNPCYNQLEVGFRHTPLRPKEIEDRKSDCLKEISELVLFIIDNIKKDGINNES